MKKRRPLHLHLLLAGLLAGTAACRSHARSARLPALADPMAELSGDPALEADLETLDVRTVEQGDERVLEFGLRNRTAAKLELSYAVEWFDRGGERIPGSARAWTPAKIEAGATCPVRVPLPSPDASSWRLRAVRPGATTLTQGATR